MTEFEEKMSNIEKKFCSSSSKDIQRLCNVSRERKLTLCLGAGVTSCYVGNWNQLLNEISSSVFWSRAQERLAGMRLSGMRRYLENVTGLPEELSTLEKGEYLILAADDGVGRDNDWDSCEKSWWREMLFAGQTREAISRIMARKMGCKVSEVYDKLARDFVTKMTREGDESLLLSLEAVLEMCILGPVRKIINYNFDTVFEHLLVSDEVMEYFKKKYSKAIVNPKRVLIYNAFHDTPDIPELCFNEKESDTMEIYHVHGLLDREVEIKPIIFSEKSYERMHRAILNWSNVQISSAFFSGIILCVGFSGNDNNFRNVCRMIQSDENRILSQMGSTNRKHQENRVFLIRSFDAIKNMYLCGSSSPTAIDGAYALNCVQTYAEMIEKYYYIEYGIKHIWVKNFADVARVLGMIR